MEAAAVTTLEQLPKNATHWSRKSMADHSGLPASERRLQVSTDPLFVEKVCDVVGLYSDPPEGAVVLSVDEKSQIQAPDRSQPVLPMMPGSAGKTAEEILDSLAHFRRRISGAGH